MTTSTLTQYKALAGNFSWPVVASKLTEDLRGAAITNSARNLHKWTFSGNKKVQDWCGDHRLRKTVQVHLGRFLLFTAWQYNLLCRALHICLAVWRSFVKRRKLGSRNIHYSWLYFLPDKVDKVHPEILKGSPRATALNETGVGKSCEFRPKWCKIGPRLLVITNRKSH